MRVTAGIGGITQNLTGSVDSGRIRDSEAGVGRNQCIEIDWTAVTDDEADVLAGPEWMVAGYREDRDPDYLARGIDARRVGPCRPGYRAQIGPDAIAIKGRV